MAAVIILDCEQLVITTGEGEWGHSFIGQVGTLCWSGQAADKCANLLSTHTQQVASVTSCRRSHIQPCERTCAQVSRVKYYPQMPVAAVTPVQALADMSR